MGNVMNEKEHEVVETNPGHCGRGYGRRQGSGRGYGNGRHMGMGQGLGLGCGNRPFNHRRLAVGDEGHLCDLKRGQKCIVLDFHNDNKALRRRLLDMGITKGVEIELKKMAPLGDPIDIYLRGYELCLRKADMRGIDIKVIG